MGVINITPDSFSDGGKITSSQVFKERVLTLQKLGASIIDIGAHSTAPSAPKVAQDEEIKRWSVFLLPHLKNWNKDLVISIDTYRPEIFKWLYCENPQLQWIFNDVSGHLEMDILESCPNAQVVLGHNLCPGRESAGLHLNYLPSGDLLNHMEKFFKSKNLTSRVILDPLFGFSKNLEQNLYLLQRLPELVKRFPPNQEFLIGISKKSFLRNDLGITDSEYLHLLYLTFYLRELKDYPLVLRVHDPKIFKLGRKGFDILNNFTS